MLETIEKNLNAKMNYISKVKYTQSKKLCNLLLNNIGNTSKTTHDPDKVISNFSIYKLSNHEKSLCVNG